MSAPEDKDQSLDPIEVFTHKRQALVNVIKFTKNLNQISGSLESLIALTTGGRAHNKDYLNQLKAKVKSLTNDQLKANLKQVDNRLQQDVDTIVDIARTDIDDIQEKFKHLLDDKKKSVFDFLDEYLANFKRRAKLAIALRVILEQKYVDTNPLLLNFSPEELEQELKQLKSKEGEYAETVKVQIDELISDTEVILAYDGFPDEMKEHVKSVKAQLLENKEHLAAGKSLQTLPTPVEFINLDESAASSANLTPLEVEEEKPKTLEMSMDLHYSEPSKPPGFWSVFKHWLTTPMGISWKQARQELISKKYH